MKTITFEGKGGAGKTTTCSNLAVAAHRAGYRVGLVDADPQASLRDWRHLRGTADIPVVPCRAGELPAALGRAVRANFDFVLVDMPPGFGADTLTIVGLADFMLLPLRPTITDLRVTRRWIEILRSAAKPFGAFINAAPPRRQGTDAPAVRDARIALRDLRVQVWRGQITHRLAIPLAAVGGRSVAETDPGGPAALEYSALWQSIERLLDPSPRKSTDENNPTTHAA